MARRKFTLVRGYGFRIPRSPTRSPPRSPTPPTPPPPPRTLPAANPSTCPPQRSRVVVKRVFRIPISNTIDLALMLFSQSAHPIIPSGSRSVEDIVIQLLRQPPESQGGISDSRRQELSNRLRRIQFYREMLSRIAWVEAMQRELDLIRQNLLAVETELNIWRPQEGA